MSDSLKKNTFTTSSKIQLHQTSSFQQHSQKSEDDMDGTPIIQFQKPLTNDIFGIFCTVIFFSLIFCLVCGFVLYQQNIQQKHLLNNQDQQTIGQPYKEGDQVDETYDLVLLNTTNALCLDGTPGSYYESRTGDPSHLLIFFEGGGWCYGLDQESTLEDCLSRSKGRFGTSSQEHHPVRLTFSKNIFSKHPDNYFRNWKKIFLNYCDGSGHQGTRRDPVEIKGQKIYFRGHNITIESFENLQEKFGLYSKAKKVVVSGLSAGGLAVFTWANYLAQTVKNGIVYAIPDAGIFYDAQNINQKKHVYRELMKNMMKIANAEIDPPNPECIKEHPGEKVNCMFAQNLYKHIKVPMFVIQSVYDSWSLRYILGIRCRNLNNCPGNVQQVMEQNRKNVTGLLEEIGSKPRNGVFGIGCILHGMTQFDDYLSTRHTIPSSSTWTLSKAIGQWFKNMKINNTRLDNKPWPSNKGCAQF